MHDKYKIYNWLRSLNVTTHKYIEWPIKNVPLSHKKSRIFMFACIYSPLLWQVLTFWYKCSFFGTPDNWVYFNRLLYPASPSQHYRFLWWNEYDDVIIKRKEGSFKSLLYQTEETRKRKGGCHFLWNTKENVKISLMVLTRRRQLIHSSKMNAVQRNLEARTSNYSRAFFHLF